MLWGREKERGRLTMRCALWGSGLGRRGTARHSGDGWRRPISHASGRIVCRRGWWPRMARNLLVARAGGRGTQSTRHVTIAVPKHRLRACERRREQRCAGTFVDGMQLKSSAEHLTASHNMHPYILGLWVVGGNPKPTKPDPAGIWILRPRACAACSRALHLPSHHAGAPGRQAGQEEKSATRSFAQARAKLSTSPGGGTLYLLAARARYCTVRLLSTPYHYLLRTAYSMEVCIPWWALARFLPRRGRCDAGTFCLLGLVIRVRSQQRGLPCQCAATEER